jgi:hypothetical protein
VRAASRQINAYSTAGPTLLLAIALCLSASPSGAANLYKWVDDDGSVHYSSRLPPGQHKKSHQQISREGVVLSTKDAAKTDEELAEEAKQAEEAAEAKRLKEIQDKKDRVLLLTFSNEEELEQVRDNRIEVIDSVIRLINSSIETTQEKLDKLQLSAEQNYTSKGEDVPGGLAQKIEHFERKINSRNIQLEAKTEEKEKIREKYEADLKRYRELKSASN